MSNEICSQCELGYHERCRGGDCQCHCKQKKGFKMKTIKEKLIAAAKRIDKANYAAYRILNENNQKLSYPRTTNYRSAFGPYKVKSEVFETRSFYFDPVNLHATSYGWWSMLIVVKGKLIRNAYGYSMQTSIHQNVLDRALKALKIKPDIMVSTKHNIGDVNLWREHSISELGEAIAEFDRARIKDSYHKNRLLKDFNKLVKADIFKKLNPRELNIAIQTAKANHADKLVDKRKQRARERETSRTQMIQSSQVEHAAPLHLVKD